jgi:hypothetical protein
MNGDSGSNKRNDFASFSPTANFFTKFNSEAEKIANTDCFMPKVRTFARLFKDKASGSIEKIRPNTKKGRLQPNIISFYG